VDSTGNIKTAKGSYPLVCNKTGKKDFIIDPLWRNYKNEILFNGLSVKTINLGNCVEKDELLFLFSDNSKLSLKS